jgi:hypothetical protein
MQVNVPGTATFSGMSTSPLGKSFTGDYKLTFDAWQNFNGPFPGGGSGSTQMTGGGIGTDGTSAQFPGGTLKSAMFVASGDGGTNPDYRAYLKPGAPIANTTAGVYAAGTQTGSTNNSDPYYAGFGGVSAPADQTTLYSQQTGATAVGSLGMAWHTWTITKTGDTVSWAVDDLPIATVNATSADLGGDNIFLNAFDINATSSTDPNAGALLFGLIDNVQVDVPEPGALGLAGVVFGVLGLRRRRR